MSYLGHPQLFYNLLISEMLSCFGKYAQPSDQICLICVLGEIMTDPIYGRHEQHCSWYKRRNIGGIM